MPKNEMKKILSKCVGNLEMVIYKVNNPRLKIELKREKSELLKLCELLKINWEPKVVAQAKDDVLLDLKFWGRHKDKEIVRFLYHYYSGAIKTINDLLSKDVSNKKIIKIYEMFSDNLEILKKINYVIE